MKNACRIIVVTAGFLMSAACGGSSSDATSSSGSGAGGGAVEGQDPPTTLITAPDGASLTMAAKNHLWMCPRPGLGPNLVASDTPWVSGTTIDVSKIAFVPGSVTWQSQFQMTMTDTQRMLVGNGLPNHPTGTFPIPMDSDAYSYYAALPAQGYDNAAEIPIAAYDLNVTITRDPTPNAKPTCVQWIFLGVVTQTGAAWHAEIAPDQNLKLHDPISALPLDDCWGHPYNTQYHYHAYSWKCFPNQGKEGEHSPLFGYAIDGFGIYGPRGEGGKLVTNDDLDECHGHTHMIEWDGKMVNMYHYHTNNEYPYMIGCYRGTPAQLPKILQN